MNFDVASKPSLDRMSVRKSERKRSRSSAVRMLLYFAQFSVDCLAILIGFGVANLIWLNRLNQDVFEIAGLILPFYLLICFYNRGYTISSFRDYTHAAARPFGALFVAFAMLLLLAFGTEQLASYSRGLIALDFLTATTLIVLGRMPLVYLVRHWLDRDVFSRVFVVDDIEVDVPTHFDRLDVAKIGLQPDVNDPLSLNEFSWLVTGYDQVVIACPTERRKAWSYYLQAVGCAGELLIPELRGIASTWHQTCVEDIPCIVASSGPLDLRDRALKRTLDLGLAVPLLFFLSPIFLVVALAIKLDSQGPVFFRQQRMGRGNRLFHILKFRSMHSEGTDHHGERSASRTDERITRVGRFIRAVSLDELPQLLNIVHGDMSLVGPRPHALGSRAGDQLFWHIDPQYWLRHTIKPGLTGLAQVRGFRGATDHHEDLARRLHSDLEYLKDWTIFSDIMILGRTAAVIVHRNAF